MRRKKPRRRVGDSCAPWSLSEARSPRKSFAAYKLAGLMTAPPTIW